MPHRIAAQWARNLKRRGLSNVERAWTAIVVIALLLVGAYGYNRYTVVRQVQRTLVQHTREVRTLKTRLEKPTIADVRRLAVVCAKDRACARTVEKFVAVETPARPPIRGPRGLRGPRGKQGKPGRSIRGKRGPKGRSGRRGGQGARGAAGEKGVKGDRGEPGPSGKDGVSPPAATGPQGPPGPTTGHPSPKPCPPKNPHCS